MVYLYCIFEMFLKLCDIKLYDDIYDNLYDNIYDIKLYDKIYDIKYSYLIQIVCKHIYLNHRGNPKFTIPCGPSGLMSNVDKRVLHTSQRSRSESSPTDAVKFHIQDTIFRDSLTPLHGVLLTNSRSTRQSRYINSIYIFNNLFYNFVVRLET